MTLHLPEDLRNEILDHCLAEAPNEGCGLIAISDGAVVRVYKTANKDASPSGFTVPPRELYEALSDAESHGWEIGGVFHSHPKGTARPSKVDVMGALDPEWFYLVIGLAGEPQLQAWRILGDKISEVPVE